MIATPTVDEIIAKCTARSGETGMIELARVCAHCEGVPVFAAMLDSHAGYYCPACDAIYLSRSGVGMKDYTQTVRISMPAGPMQAKIKRLLRALRKANDDFIAEIKGKHHGKP